MIEFIEHFVDKPNGPKATYRKDNKFSMRDTKSSEASIEESGEAKGQVSTAAYKRRLFKKKSHSNVIYCLPKKTLRQLISSKFNEEADASMIKNICGSPANQVRRCFSFVEANF